MNDVEFHTALLQANTTLMKKYHDCKLKDGLSAAEDLYLKGDTSFRGFRDV